MNLSDLMRTTPENLARTQRDALCRYVLDRLEEVVKLFREEAYEDILAMLTLSPAGDECGTDHYFLDFRYESMGSNMDLQEIIEQIQGLNAVVTQREQNKRR